MLIIVKPHTNEMSRYLGIDYGDKRVGIAISDEEGHFAFPKEVLLKSSFAKASEDKIVETILKIIKENNIGVVVLGLPQNFDSKDTKQTKTVRAFAEQLKSKIGVEIIFQNEILTSAQIDKSGGAKQSMHDASAAALILQQFLDYQRSE